MSMQVFKFKQGEAKTIGFIVKDDDTGEELDMTNYDYRLSVKQSPDFPTYTFEKTTSAFGTTNESVGRITVFVASGDTNQSPMDYWGELKLIAPGSGDRAVYKTEYFIFKIQQAITPVSGL